MLKANAVVRKMVTVKKDSTVKIFLLWIMEYAGKVMQGKVFMIDTFSISKEKKDSLVDLMMETARKDFTVLPGLKLPHPPAKVKVTFFLSVFSQ